METNHEEDIPRMINYDYLGLFLDNMAYEMYDIEDTCERVIALRNRPQSINVKIRFDAEGFLI